MFDFDKLLYLYLEHRIKAEIHDLNVRLIGYLRHKQKDEAEILQEVVADRQAKLKDVMMHLKFLETNPQYHGLRL